MKGKKTGGRVVGSLNKRTVEAIEVFGAFDFCPLQKILEEMTKPGIPPELYMGTCMKLMEFKFPKRKAIENTVNLADMPMESLIEEAKSIIESVESNHE
jgi:hypothetical protein